MIYIIIYRIFTVTFLHSKSTMLLRILKFDILDRRLFNEYQMKYNDDRLLENLFLNTYKYRLYKS